MCHLQEPATQTMSFMNGFHELLLFVMIVILINVIYVLFEMFKKFVRVEKDNIKNNFFLKQSNTKFSHSYILEIAWTIIPAFILLIIGFPSFGILYVIEDMTNPLFNLNIIGHQWYWSYEYCFGFENKYIFNSYMLLQKALGWGKLRLLEVDNRVLLPSYLNVRLLVTASDVIHSWTIPSFGIKIDACPGRLIQGGLSIQRNGLFFGQCSEICGVNHGFMPIVVESLEPSIFISLTKEFIKDEKVFNTLFDEIINKKYPYSDICGFNENSYEFLLETRSFMFKNKLRYESNLNLDRKSNISTYLKLFHESKATKSFLDHLNNLNFYSEKDALDFISLHNFKFKSFRILSDQYRYLAGLINKYQELNLYQYHMERGQINSFFIVCIGDAMNEIYQSEFDNIL